jgi:hypothetical protein
MTQGRLTLVAAVGALVVSMLGWAGSATSAPSALTAKPHTHAVRFVTRIVRQDLTIPAATGSIEDETLEVGQAEAVVNCPAGWARTGGGVTSEFGFWDADEPVAPNGWRGGFYNTYDEPVSGTAFAVCSKVTAQKARA